MSALPLLRRLWQHARWADDTVQQVIDPANPAHADAWREYLHILGAQEVWLSRMQHRERRIDVWPAMGVEDASEMRRSLAEAYESLLATASELDLDRLVEYRTTDGRGFGSTVGDILTQVMLHGQYHRGKVNLMLRQSADRPAPVDFIAFTRGSASATARQGRAQSS